MGASLVVQWLRVRLPMQRTRVRAPVREDPTCRGAAGPVSHGRRACASGAEYGKFIGKTSLRKDHSFIPGCIYLLAQLVIIGHFNLMQDDTSCCYPPNLTSRQFSTLIPWIPLLYLPIPPASAQLTLMLLLAAFFRELPLGYRSPLGRMHWEPEMGWDGGN